MNTFQTELISLFCFKDNCQQVYGPLISTLSVYVTFFKQTRFIPFKTNKLLSYLPNWDIFSDSNLELKAMKTMCKQKWHWNKVG